MALTIDFTGVASPPYPGAAVYPSTSLFPDGQAGGIPSAEAFGTPTVAVNQTVSPDGIASAEAFGTVKLVQFIGPDSITSGEAFGAPTVQVSGFVFPASIPSDEAFGSFTVTTRQIVSPASVPSEEAFGAVLVGGIQVVSPTGIPSEEAFGTPQFNDVISIPGIESEEAFGTPTVTNGFWRLINPSRTDRYRLGEPTDIIHTQITVGFTVFGNGTPLRVEENPLDDDLQASRYVWMGGHDNITSDAAIRDLWLANNLGVEMAFV